ncbi:hypothetical protein NUSPORA_00071 [Nucleospora cyclopteri]
MDIQEILTDTGLDTVEKIQNEIKEASLHAKTLKVEILKHFLLNFCLLENTPESEREFSPIKEKLGECTILYKKLLEIEKGFVNIEKERKVVGDIKRNKKFSSKNANSLNPKAKYKRKFNKQKQEIEADENRKKNKTVKY